MGKNTLPFSTPPNVIGPQSVNARALRAVLERITTSTALITASGSDRRMAGIAASGFNSILDTPPMVLWSLARSACGATVFREATHWAVHVLAPCQTDLRARLALAGDHRFEGVTFAHGIEGVPLLDGCLARIVCRRVQVYETFDHFVVVGEVIQLQHNEPAAHEHDALGSGSSRGAEPADVGDDSLGFLLGSAFFYMYGQLREAGGKMGFTNIELFVIMALGERGWRSRREINTLLYYGGHSTNLQVLDDLEASGLLVSRNGASEHSDDMQFELTPAGQHMLARFASVGVGIERDMERLLGAPATGALRKVLREFVNATEDRRPVKWR